MKGGQEGEQKNNKYTRKDESSIKLNISTQHHQQLSNSNSKNIS